MADRHGADRERVDRERIDRERVDRENLASLDDLLWEDEEPLRERPTDSAGTWFVKHLAYALLLGGLLWLCAWIVGYQLPYPVLVAGLLAVFGLHRVVREVAPPPPAAPLVRGNLADYTEGELQWPVTDGLYTAVVRWDNRLSWTQRDPDRFESTVRPHLDELIDELLRQRHGLTRASDPARARALLGDPLWAFLATPVTRSPTPRQLTGVVRQLEEL